MEWERLKTIVEALYKRPKQLSDPSSDFSQEELDALIATPDEAMACHDFMCIFQTSCPAGCYAECAYFIPLAVKYIETNRSDALSVLDCLLGWMDENREQLKRDKLWMAAASCLCQIIGREMLRFELEDVAFNSYSLTYPASGLNWFDTLRRTDGVKPSILGLIVLGKLFREHFSHIDSYPVAAWLVYLGTHTMTSPYHVYLAARLADSDTREAACRLIRAKCREDAVCARFWAPLLDELATRYPSHAAPPRHAPAHLVRQKPKSQPCLRQSED